MAKPVKRQTVIKRKKFPAKGRFDNQLTAKMFAHTSILVYKAHVYCAYNCVAAHCM